MIQIVDPLIVRPIDERNIIEKKTKRHVKRQLFTHHSVLFGKNDYLCSTQIGGAAFLPHLTIIKTDENVGALK